jgi:hypothetical protein
VKEIKSCIIHNMSSADAVQSKKDGGTKTLFSDVANVLRNVFGPSMQEKVVSRTPAPPTEAESKPVERVEQNSSVPSPSQTEEEKEVTKNEEDDNVPEPPLPAIINGETKPVNFSGGGKRKLRSPPARKRTVGNATTKSRRKSSVKHLKKSSLKKKVSKRKRSLRPVKNN